MFTDRQRQLVTILAQGNNLPEAAKIMGISPRTAKAYAEVLRFKLDVKHTRKVPAAYVARFGALPESK